MIKQTEVGIVLRHLSQGRYEVRGWQAQCLCAVLIVIGFAFSAPAEDERGWNFSGRFSGSSNSSGLVLKADPALGYKFNEHFQTYAGLPVYFVNASSTTTTTTTTTSTTATSSGFVNGT